MHALTWSQDLKSTIKNLKSNAANSSTETLNTSEKNSMLKAFSKNTKLEEKIIRWWG